MEKSHGCTETEQNITMKLLLGNLGYYHYSFKKIFSTHSKHHPYVGFHLWFPVPQPSLSGCLWAQEAL